MDATHYAGYRQAVLSHLAAYRQRHFAGRDALFEAGPRGEMVFRSDVAHLNFFDPALYHALTDRPPAFRRLSSARVLAISVVGTLARREDLGLLTGVACDDGRPVLAGAGAAQALTLDLQRPLPSLQEGGRSVVDLWLQGEGVGLAVVGTLLERDLGPCPQPRRGRCDGNYGRRGASWECPYGGQWEHLPALLGWDGRREQRPCPLHKTLGLVRTLLALGAPAKAGGQEARRSVLLVGDARNPAWAPTRQAGRLVAALQRDLRPPAALRRTTWQAIATAMARSHWYADLLEYLAAKYGIEGDADFNPGRSAV